jgi:hypothetical protein
VHTSYGGSTIEQWLTNETIATCANASISAVGTGLALRKLALKPPSIGERHIGNHRKHRSLARDWPAL